MLVNAGVSDHVSKATMGKISPSLTRDMHWPLPSGTTSNLGSRKQTRGTGQTTPEVIFAGNWNSAGLLNGATT